MFFRIQVFWVHFFQGPGFSESGSRVRVQVLEVAKIKFNINVNDPETTCNALYSLCKSEANTKLFFMT